MATAISAMTALESLASGDHFPVVDVSDTTQAVSGTTKRTTFATLAAAVIASDGELAALAGLTSAADRLPYFTGSGTASLATFTAGGRALVNSAGTADTFPYFSASNTVTLGAVTAFGRSFIDDADAAAGMTTLGFSANAQSLVTAANYAAMKTLLSLNNVENTALSTWAGSANITTLGTIGTGTWNATAIGVSKGGTGATTLTSGGLLVGNGTSAISAISGYAAEATVASATTTDIGAAASLNVSITGTTTITGLGTVAAGTHRYCRFTGALTLTHNATSLILPGGANITTAAGDRMLAESLGSGNWVVLFYQKADGTAIAGGAGGGDASTNTATSVDSEVALFSGTGGKTLKRATGSGVALLTSGVLSTFSLGTNVQTFLTTPSSANLKSAITDETGSGGALVFATGPTLTGAIEQLNAIPGTDDTYEGKVLIGRNAGATIAQWDAVYLDSSGTWQLADANGTGTFPARGLAVAAYSNTNPATVITYGSVRNDAWTWTVGGTIYLSTTAGGLTQTAPSTSGDKVQVMGWATSADTMLVDPSPDYLTVA